MSVISRGAPMFANTGVKDSPEPVNVYAKVSIPQHMPHIMLLTETGPDIQMVSGTSLSGTFGEETFNIRGAYYNHQTLFCQQLNELGNAMMVQRLRPKDAPPPAVIGLGIEIVKTTLPVYERELNGDFKLDVDGEKIDTGTTTEGHLARWVRYVPVNGELGKAKKKAGTLVGEAGEQSDFYPIGEFQVSFFGGYGNNCGIRLFAPTVNSGTPVNDRLIGSQNCYVYRIQCMQRANANSTPVVKRTLLDELSVDFALKPGVWNPDTEAELFADQVILDAYRTLQPIDGSTPVYGPFNGMHWYHENIAQLSKEVFELEKLHMDLADPAPEGSEYLINLFSGYSYLDIPYYTLVVQGANDGEISLSETATHYASGGGDGTVSVESYEELVGEQFDNYGELDIPLLDTAKYPFSVYYDSGFNLEIKKKFYKAMGARRDLYVVMSTQDASLPQNTPTEEMSIGLALRTRARMFPESTEFGTEAFRALTVGQSGYLARSQYTKLVPATIEIARMFGAYMGASDGRYKPGAGFDRNPNNMVKLLTGIPNTFKSATVRNKYWDDGIIWIESFDQDAYFFPAIRTVYGSDTSVLNSAINMAGMVDVTKQVENVWREFTGRSDLSNAQLCARVDARIIELCANRYDERFIIRPESTVSAMDKLRGYSWTTVVHFYGYNMKTVTRFTLEAHRREDLE